MERGVYSGREGGVDSGSIAYSIGKKKGIFWDVGVDPGRVAHRCLKGCVFYDGVLHSVSVAYSS